MRVRFPLFHIPTLTQRLDRVKHIVSSRLPTNPPLRQFRTAPTEADIPAQSRVGDGIGAAAAALLPHPRSRNSPAFRQVFRRKDLEERPSYTAVAVLRLCSSHFHALSFSSLLTLAVS